MQYPVSGYPEEPLTLSNGHAMGEYLEQTHDPRSHYIEQTITAAHPWSQDSDTITVQARLPTHTVTPVMPQFDHMRTDFPILGVAPPMPEAGPSSLPDIVPAKKTPKLRLPPKKVDKMRSAEVRPSPERPGAGPRAPRNTHCDTCHRVNVVDDAGNRETMLSCWSCGKSGQWLVRLSGLEEDEAYIVKL
jgi:hypothetical protein